MMIRLLPVRAAARLGSGAVRMAQTLPLTPGNTSRAALASTALVPLALALAPPAQAGEAVVYAPAPAWVEPAALPADTAGPPLIVYDDQRRIEEGVLTSYVDQAIRIDNPQMLQALGTVQAGWMPDKGDLTVHAITILRDGQEIDLLAQGARFEVLRREAMLEQRMLDGERTATLAVPGLRVGDVLRTSYTVTLSDQALDQEVQATAMLPAAPFEAQQARVVMSWPSSAGIAWKLLGARDLAAVETAAGYERVAIDLPLPERDEPPADAPLRYRIPAMLQAGTFDGWAEVSAVMAPLYATSDAIAPGSPVATEVARIAAAHSGTIERAVSALRLVQEEIAYQANGMDGGNYIPQSPAHTWDIRYGDCKAKTLLLLAMLRAMDIEAEAALVASAAGDVVPDMLPLPGAFDHVIVRAIIDGRDYWLDGTSMGASLAVAEEVPPFHHALPIRERGAQLMAMVQRPQTAWDQRSTLTFDHRAGLDVPVPWTGEWVLTGVAAAQFSGLIGQANEEQIERVVHGFVAQTVPDSWIIDTGLAYDEAANTATVSVEGLIVSPFAWERGRGQRGFDLLPTAGFQFRPDRSRRAWDGIPVALPGPYSRASEVTLLLPEAAGYELDGRDTFDETIAGVKLARQARLDGATLVVTDSAAWPGGELAFERIAEERAAASRFGSTELLLRAPADAVRSFDATSRENRARFAPIEEAYAALVAKDPDDANVYRARAWFRGITLDREGALADLDTIVALEPAALSYLARANMLLELGRIDAALADAQLAWELNPSLEAAYVLADVYGETGRVEEAIALLDEQNGDAAERAGLAMAISELEARAGRKEAGLARLDDLLARRPGDPDMLNAKCWYQATWNFRPEELETLCTEAVERADWSPPVLDSRAMGYFRLGRYEDALQDLNAALTDSPDQSPSLYLRGLVRLELGDTGGRRDIEEALARQPSLARDFARWGIGRT